MHSAERPRSIPEFSIVALRQARECHGKTLPAGATGAVVYVYRDGAVYEVEFDKPFHCVVTVGQDDIRPI